MSVFDFVRKLLNGSLNSPFKVEIECRGVRIFDNFNRHVRDFENADLALRYVVDALGLLDLCHQIRSLGSAIADEKAEPE